MGKKAIENKELVKFLEEMEIGAERTIMAIDGKEDSVMPDLAMGVIKEKFFDSETTTFLVGVYGSDCHFKAFFNGDYESEYNCIISVIVWLEQTAVSMCGMNYGGLYIKPTDEEEQSFYEENKFNGDIVREVDTLGYDIVCLVARFDVDEGNFYDMYEKDGGGYLGELHTENLESLTDSEIENIIKENMEIGW